MKKGLKAFFQGDSYSMSYLMSTAINMLAVATAVGITMQLKVDSIEGFILFVVLFTLLDTMIGLLIKRYFFQYVVQSFGLILALVGLILIFITEQLVPDVYFESVFGIIGFTVFFLVLRLLLIYTYEKTIGQKKGLK
jgi:hypothetical protein